MKRIAVVGSGLAGLSAAYALSSLCKVVIFDHKGVGGGASGIAAGLLHPYAGKKGLLSWESKEALMKAKALIDQAEKALGVPTAHRGGILREGLITSPLSDVISLGENKHLITSGWTVFSSLYLQGLWRLCEQNGVDFEPKEITSLRDVQQFDGCVIAVGAGIRFFKEFEGLNLGFVKGQLLTCHFPTILERSISSTIYTALSQNPYECHIGATYERDFIHEEPCLETATRLLKPSYPIIECRSGIRVTNRAHYFPILHQIGKFQYVITALGSRGLLYHALFADKLKEAFVTL
ncbi:MAG: FAD-dependent oxidoreductase [Candidatus Rhabdochlamydia sp.]